MALTGFVQTNSPNYLSDSLAPQYAFALTSNKIEVIDFTQSIIEIGHGGSEEAHWDSNGNIVVLADDIFGSYTSFVRVNVPDGSTTDFGDIQNISGQNQIYGVSNFVTDPDNSNIIYMTDSQRDQDGNGPFFKVRKIELDTYNVVDEWESSLIDERLSTLNPSPVIGRRKMVCGTNHLSVWYGFTDYNGGSQFTAYASIDTSDMTQSAGFGLSGDFSVYFIGTLVKKTGGMLALYAVSKDPWQTRIFDLETGNVDYQDNPELRYSADVYSPQLIRTRSASGDQYITSVDGSLTTTESNPNNSSHKLIEAAKYDQNQYDIDEIHKFPKGYVLHNSDYSGNSMATRIDDFNVSDINVHKFYASTDYIRVWPCANPVCSERWNAEIGIKNEEAE